MGFNLINPFVGKKNESVEPIDKTTKEEISGLRELIKGEQKTKEKNTNTECFSVIVFQNNSELKKFYEILGLKNIDDQYVNGRKLLEALGEKTEKIQPAGKFRCNKDLLLLTKK